MAGPTATTWSAFKKQYNALEQEQAGNAGQQVPPNLPNAAGMTRARVQGNWSPAPATGPAEGNWQVTSDARGQNPAAYPGAGMGGPSLVDTGPENQSPYGGISSQQIRPWVRTPPSLVNKQAYGGARYQHGRLIAYDRHVVASQGKTASSANQQATGGSPNPEKDGPPQTSHKMLNRVLSWQIGTHDTRGLDNGGFHATVAEIGTGKPQPLGTQGAPRSKVYGGTPGLANFRPYGSRTGYQGGPTPTVYAQAGGPYRYGTLLQQGSPQDGPQQVYPGVPHGLHSATVQPVWITTANQKIRIQQVHAPYRTRPLNSKIAGQSYSQTVVHLDGSQAVQAQKLPASTRPGVMGRFL